MSPEVGGELGPALDTLSYLKTCVFVEVRLPASSHQILQSEGLVYDTQPDRPVPWVMDTCRGLPDTCMCHGAYKKQCKEKQNHLSSCLPAPESKPSCY